MPRSASNSSMISATSRTCSGLSALGSAIACTPGPITASRSRTVIRSGRLMRTSDVGAAARDDRGRLGHQRAGALLFRGGDRNLEIEDDRVGAAPRRAVDKAPLRHRHEQQRAPDRQIVAHGHCLLDDDALRRASPSSAASVEAERWPRISAVCSPSSGAGRRRRPGVSDRRGMMLCIGDGRSRRRARRRRCRAPGHAGRRGTGRCRRPARR